MNLLFYFLTFYCTILFHQPLLSPSESCCFVFLFRGTKIWCRWSLIFDFLGLFLAALILVWRCRPVAPWLSVGLWRWAAVSQQTWRAQAPLNNRTISAANVCLMQIRQIRRCSWTLAALFARLGANMFNVLLGRYLFSCEAHFHKEGGRTVGSGRIWNTLLGKSRTTYRSSDNLIMQRGLSMVFQGGVHGTAEAGPGGANRCCSLIQLQN